ncbi:hypothetical protein M5689_000743 [Euphorbia peplus]|nr:hypothetical protein M5689_000743 [Euphorbia peplus]
MTNDNINNHEPMYNFDHPIYEIDSGEESAEEVPVEIEKMLEAERKSMEPLDDGLETVNLGTKEEPREVKINGNLDLGEKERLANLLKEYKVLALSRTESPRGG